MIRETEQGIEGPGAQVHSLEIVVITEGTYVNNMMLHVNSHECEEVSKRTSSFLNNKLQTSKPGTPWARAELREQSF